MVLIYLVIIYFDWLIPCHLAIIHLSQLLPNLITLHSPSLSLTPTLRSPPLPLLLTRTLNHTPLYPLSSLSLYSHSHFLASSHNHPPLSLSLSLSLPPISGTVTKNGTPIVERKRKHVKDTVLYDLLEIEPEATQGKSIKQ